MKMRFTPTEHDEAVAFASWLEWNNVTYLHPPNEGKRSFAAAARLKREGMKKGAPDFLIFTPSKIDPTWRGLAIELKRAGTHGRAAGRPTPPQVEFLASLDRCGWKTAICWGADEAIAACIEYGVGRAVGGRIIARNGLGSVIGTRSATK